MEDLPPLSFWSFSCKAILCASRQRPDRNNGGEFLSGFFFVCVIFLWLLPGLLRWERVLYNFFLSSCGLTQLSELQIWSGAVVLDIKAIGANRVYSKWQFDLQVSSVTKQGTQTYDSWLVMTYASWLLNTVRECNFLHIPSIFSYWFL